MRSMFSSLKLGARYLSTVRSRVSWNIRTSDRLKLGLALERPDKMQKFKNFLILDFESTCERNKKIKPQVRFFLVKQDSLSKSLLIVYLAYLVYTCF